MSCYLNQDRFPFITLLTIFSKDGWHLKQRVLLLASDEPALI